MKKVIFFVGLTILAFALNGCSGNQNSESKGDIMVSMNTFCGGYWPGYHFRLTSDKKLYVASGIMYDPSSEDENFMDVEKEKTVKLSDKQFDELKALLDNLGDFQGEKFQVFDAWDCVILYQGKTYRFTYGTSKNENYDSLVAKLIEFSPIKIVSSGGYEAEPVKPEEFGQ